MQLDINKLHRVCEILFQLLEQKGVEVVEFQEDYYWNIPRNQKYNPYEEPSNLDLGQLSDNWHELQEILELEREPIVYHLVWLSEIFRAIGENIPY